MQVYIDLENLLKEKNISKNKVCEACKLQRTQLNNYCKNKVPELTSQSLQSSVIFWNVPQTTY